MTTLLQDVAAVARHLQRLKERLTSEQPVSKCLQNVQNLLESLAYEFDLSAYGQRGRKRSAQDQGSGTKQIGQLLNKSWYQSGCLAKQREALSFHLGHPVGGRVCIVWFLRVSLSPPNVPARKLVEWCRDFNVDLHQTIGYGTVVRARDAMCEIVKEWNKKRIAASIAVAQTAEPTSRSLRIYVPHVHDEACFRMRSYQTNHAAGKRASCLSRAPSSKILNHIICANVHDSSLTWLQELQPLSKK